MTIQPMIPGTVEELFASEERTLAIKDMLSEFVVNGRRGGKTEKQKLLLYYLNWEEQVQRVIRENLQRKGEIEHGR